MRRSGMCPDNAVVERFLATLEWGVDEQVATAGHDRNARDLNCAFAHPDLWRLYIGSDCQAAPGWDGVCISG